jgi:hypothetical protein
MGKCRTYDAKLKARALLDALRGPRTLGEDAPREIEALEDEKDGEGVGAHAGKSTNGS